MGIFTYLKIGAVAAVAVALGILYWSWQSRGEEIKTLTASVAIEKANVETLKGKIAEQGTVIARLETQRESDQKEISRIGAEKAAADALRDSEVSRLNAFRSRINAEILSRPLVYERAASMASRRVMLDIERISAGPNGDGRASGADHDSAGPGTDPGNPN